ncbi:hypothetical protein [Govanella unica]|uniref:Uncharacterized protein n=1 Tax=Govanella unica TaxID=2975056 RepID=A0A9X3Z664_9PROT|nr:hypothetical protein [Govania unica]MDA5192870.1 hypothetical protein [Govania unica]
MAAGTAIFSFGDPLTGAVLLPFAVSALTVALVRLLLGDGRGSTLANLGLGVGVMAAWLLLFGFPGWPAFAMGDKALFLMFFGLLIGAAADRLPALDPVILLLLTAWPVILVLWLLEPTISGGLSGTPLIRFGLLLIGAATLFVRLREEQDNGQSATVHIIWFGVALGVIAYVTRHHPLEQAGAAIAAAAFGYLVWNLPVTRYPFGFAALLSGGSAVAALAAILIAQGVTAPLWPLLLLLFAGEIGAKLFRQKRGALAVALGGTVPTALAVAIAYLTR